jgi:kynureninase
VDVPNGQAVADELIRREVIVDYRPGAGIRMAPHFYNTMDEIEHAMAVLADIVQATAAR